MGDIDKTLGKPLAQLRIGELGELGNLLVDECQVIEKRPPSMSYFGNFRSHSSFASTPGAHEVKTVNGFVALANLYHRLLRNISVGIAGLVDEEKLGEIKPQIDWLRNTATEMAAAHFKPGGKKPDDLEIPGKIAFMGQFIPKKIPTIPIKINHVAGEPLTVEIPNNDVFVAGPDFLSTPANTLSFLVGLKVFAKVGGIASEVLSTRMRAVLHEMVIYKSGVDLTEFLDDIAENILSAVEKKYGKETAEEVAARYFRFSKKDCEAVLGSIAATEHDLQLLYLSKTINGTKLGQADLLEWLLNQAGKKPAPYLKTNSVLELDIVLNSLFYSKTLTQYLGIEPMAGDYFSVPAARERVKRINDTFPNRGKIIDKIIFMDVNEPPSKAADLVDEIASVVWESSCDISKVKGLLLSFFGKTPDELLAGELAEVAAKSKERTGRT